MGIIIQVEIKQLVKKLNAGYDYTYVITISKKGIESITCTIVDWITVKGEDINIDLES